MADLLRSSFQLPTVPVLQSAACPY